VDGIDNYDKLREMTWQVHVYGVASSALAAWCREHGLPLHVFDWRAECRAAGLRQGALYLLRPDTYVALADAAGTADAVERYFADRRIQFEPR
jgi:hypothetical protein